MQGMNFWKSLNQLFDINDKQNPAVSHKKKAQNNKSQSKS